MARGIAFGFYLHYWYVVDSVSNQTNMSLFDMYGCREASVVSSHIPETYIIDTRATIAKIMVWRLSRAHLCLLLGVSSGCARPITGEVTSVTENGPR